MIMIREVALNLWHIPLLGAASINAYLVGDVLIDAGIRSSASRLLRALAPHRLRAHALTHVHADHQGSSHVVCKTRGVPLWVHQNEVEIMEQGSFGLQQNLPDNVITRLQRQFWAGEAHPVSRALRAGDDINGFEVLETPGHAKGHISLWRETDKTLIIGDVLTNMNVMTMQAGLHLPLGVFTLDAAQNQAHVLRLAMLEPELILFGHGRPLRDPEALLRFAERLST
jgi:hydroxyacylglutathione hydrolase